MSDNNWSGSIGTDGYLRIGPRGREVFLESGPGKQLLANGIPLAIDTGVDTGRSVVAMPARAPASSSTPNTVVAGRMPLTAYVAMSGIRFVYAGMANGELLPDNETIIECAIEYPSGTIYPMTINGSRFGTLDRYGLLTSDAALVDIPAGATYYARTRVLAPNNLANLAPLNGYTTLAADVTLGASQITLTDLPKLDRSPARFKIAGAGAEVVEIVRYSGTASPYTMFLRGTLAANHTAAGSDVGQGIWQNREAYSDQGGTSASTFSATFDILSSTFGAAAASGSATTVGASTIGDLTIQTTSVSTLRGQTFTLDTAGNAETVTVRTISGVANPYTLYLTAPLTKNHGAAVALANTNSGNSIVIPVPTAVTADYAAGSPTPIILLGDSVLLASTGNYFRQWEGYAQLALEATHPVLQMSKSGESAQQFAADTNGFQRRNLFDYGSWLLYAYGVNDIYGGRTLAQFQADTITICGWARARGMKIAMSTLTPRTTSSDGWTTIGGQTIVSPGTFNAIRLTANSWIKSGASGFCDLVLDVCAAVDSGRDSGIWKADVTTGPYTVDGIHPSYTGHQLMAAAVPPGSFV